MAECIHFPEGGGENCSICLHPETRKAKPEKLEAIGPTIGAHYPGKCACGCKSHFQQGDDITMTEAGWCITDHTEMEDFFS